MYFKFNKLNRFIPNPLAGKGNRTKKDREMLFAFFRSTKN